MKVKSVVKVMNFHSLLRVEKSRRRAEKYLAIQEELERMMKPIVNNRNLQIDKYIKKPNPNNPVLRIYLGSDFGFCGSVNSYVSREMQTSETPGTERIIIGKKIRKGREAEVSMLQEEIDERFDEIRSLFRKAVLENRYSAVEVVYNRFYSISQIRPMVYRIYPLELEPDDADQTTGDYFVEGDAARMLSEMIVLYLTASFRIAAASAYASENITRRNVTQESLKKIDELETEQGRMERKEKNRLSFAKTIDNYTKQAFGGGKHK